MTFIFEIFEIQMDQLLNFLILKKETFNYLSKRSKNLNERFLNLRVPNINFFEISRSTNQKTVISKGNLCLEKERLLQNK